MTVCLVLILAVNFLGARAYGETEFWFSTMKILAIVGLIILGVVLMCGGGPNHDAIGFRYWVSPGTFALHWHLRLHATTAHNTEPLLLLPL